MPHKPSFQINGELHFQTLGHNLAFVNADESPQLYFGDMFAAGDPYAPAHKVGAGSITPTRTGPLR